MRTTRFFRRFEQMLNDNHLYLDNSTEITKFTPKQLKNTNGVRIEIRNVKKKLHTTEITVTIKSKHTMKELVQKGFETYTDATNSSVWLEVPPETHTFLLGPDTWKTSEERNESRTTPTGRTPETDAEIQGRHLRNALGMRPDSKAEMQRTMLSNIVGM